MIPFYTHLRKFFQRKYTDTQNYCSCHIKYVYVILFVEFCRDITALKQPLEDDTKEVIGWYRQFGKFKLRTMTVQYMYIHASSEIYY
jgi:hypothetical protein